jgi:phosphosulfolactate synthase
LDHNRLHRLEPGWRRTVAESDCPDFLVLPPRSVKPRATGITHVLDKGLSPTETAGLVAQAGHLIDIVKVGWGIGYIDPTLPERVAAYRAAGVAVCLGGTLTEIVALQDRLPEMRDWAMRIGITHAEVSNGLRQLTEQDKTRLIKELSMDFVVLAETGAKDGSHPAEPAGWAQEMLRDLDAGADWVVAEGRESGTIGLYAADQAIREDIVTAILDRVPSEKVIFEAPVKRQQTWFVGHLGPDVNLGNIEPGNVLALETLRLGLRADTAKVGAPV